MENMDANVVTNEAPDAEQLPEGLVEETADESEVSLEEVIDSTTESEQAADEQPAEAEPESPPAKEPGYVKQRVEKAVAKATAETEARLRAEFNAQMAPIMERLLVEDAKDLVRQGEFKNLETAKEYLRMKRNMPQPENVSQGQPRNANGQFAPKQQPADDVATQARIDMLKHQAERIKASRNVDVIAEFNNNPDVKQRIIAGEIDFYDVAEEMSSRPKKSKPPAPMRSPNGAATDQQVNAIMSMTDEQFAALQRRVKNGAVITQKK